MVSLLYRHLYDHEPKKLTSSLGLNEEIIKNAFGLVLIEFDRLATEKFRYYETKALKRLAELWLESQGPNLKENLKALFSISSIICSASIFLSVSELLHVLAINQPSL